MDFDIPRTPSRHKEESFEATSKIPSPNGPDSPKFKKRTASPTPVLTISEQRSSIANMKQHAANGDSSSHMTAFYKENIRELNELQEMMFRKKAKLDEVKDELMDYRDQFRALELKVETLREEKHTKSQQLKLKENELKKLKDEQHTRDKFLCHGHELELQQLRAKNTAEVNALDGEFRRKIEDLKYEKIKKLEVDRDSLVMELRAADKKISCNHETLQSLMEDCLLKNNADKENWLRSHQLGWKKTIEENETLTQESEVLQRTINEQLQTALNRQKTRLEELHSELESMKHKLDDCQSDNRQLETEIEKTKALTAESMNKKIELEDYIASSSVELTQINEILIKEETMRRKLHNELQEIRGNIRVFCRVRPPLPREGGDLSNISIYGFDDDQGTQTLDIIRDSKAHTFTFDRIFDRQDTNSDVFDEIGQLVQSSLDGYNVCIFAYGQTGSGKTFTMLHPEDGIIPSTLSHIFMWIEKLKELGWNYEVTSQFVEIYNETINDLLKDLDDDTEELGEYQKHEIRHDSETQTTRITNVTVCELTNREMVSDILKRASKMRSTAPTAANERSSRSHSIFIIQLYGCNEFTGEKSYGTLNLVDLAGSERINSLQSTGTRLRETQSINKSLSCLGDVIHALSAPDANKRHIPFRNSKLTYLLQYSLMGQSKTLMFVNVSPCSHSINETLNSLRFASKVNSTKMAKRT
ncbi:LAFE_0F04742g1_1 [Lachancea fermentati]|uniref:Kinesin-like protein n=1 Tax=Lachancea fermentati TaxID=4955 RepID=A0A1G4MEL0_LACFM|nr:LAFE_0F04742g1_1 [Lachancea fermentati]